MENKNKTVIVTGAARGIGKEIALSFAKQGYDVAINYLFEEDKPEEAKKECAAFGVRCETFKADVSKYDECEAMVKDINDKMGNIYALVNNAGITADGLLMRMNEEQFTKVININLNSVFNMSRLIVPILVKARCGRIINISSIAGVYGNAGQTNYAASKAGIIGFTKSLAKEVGSRNVTVNAVAPGFVETPMTAVLPDKVRDGALEKMSIKRFGKPEDIANAVVFLADEKGAYITGQVLCVDGGLTL